MKKTFAICAMLATMIFSAYSTACESGNIVLTPGQSRCFDVCIGDFFTITLEGGGRPGFHNTPVLVWGRGCNALTTNCDNPTCTPISAPDELHLGANPFYPNCYYGNDGENFCPEVLLCWDHDDQWHIEIFSLCEGCFCLTYERQLPVELQSFSAVAANNGVLVNWATASESQMDRFEVARDGNTVYSVNASNGVSTSRYTWIDENVVSGTRYNYELVAVEVSGTRQVVAHSEVTAGVSGAVVSNYALHQNFPNPFNPETKIAFDLAEQGQVKLEVFNLNGQKVATLVDANMPAGGHNVTFNGIGISSGVYLYKIEVNGFTDAKKLVLLK